MNSWRDVSILVMLQRQVIRQNAEQVKQLTLVGVQTLDLHVKDGIRIQLQAHVTLNPFGQAHLVLMLYILQLCQEVLVLCELVQLSNVLW